MNKKGSARWRKLGYSLFLTPPVNWQVAGATFTQLLSVSTVAPVHITNNAGPGSSHKLLTTLPVPSLVFRQTPELSFKI